MADVTKPPEHQLRLEPSSKISDIPNIGQDELAAGDDPVSPQSLALWPLNSESAWPLAWWRLLPPGSFGNIERLLLVETIKRISVLRGGADLAAAMRGDATAAIGVALELMPIGEITLPVEIAMTALVRVALEGNATAALVAAQVVGLTDLGHEREIELAASWLTYGRLLAAEPDKFSDAEIVLMAAFKEHRRKGNDA